MGPAGQFAAVRPTTPVMENFMIKTIEMAARYPRLFLRDLPFGFECGDGWRDILEAFFETTDKVLAESGGRSNCCKSKRRWEAYASTSGRPASRGRASALLTKPMAWPRRARSTRAKTAVVAVGCHPTAWRIRHCAQSTQRSFMRRR